MSAAGRRVTAGSRLVGGSALLLVGTNLANALHLVYHTAMARALGPAAYGVVAALFGLLGLGVVVSESVQTVAARYSQGEPAPARLHDLLRRALGRGVLASGLALVAYLALSAPAAHWLGIRYPLLAFFGLSLAGLVLLPIPRGVMMGKKRFGSLSLNLVLEAAVKLAVGAALVWWGAGEFGAVGGALAGFAAGLLVCPLQLREVLAAPREPSAAAGGWSYGVPVLLVHFTVIALASLDVVLARALLAPAAAGEYAVAAFIGKTILVGTLPIGRAMFPHAAEAARVGSGGRRVLATSIAVLAACAGAVILACLLVPAALVRLVGGGAYSQAIGIVGYLAAAMTCLAASHLLLVYRLARGALPLARLLPAAVAVQALALHLAAGSLVRFAQTTAAVALAFLLASSGVALAARHHGADTG